MRVFFVLILICCGVLCSQDISFKKENSKKEIEELTKKYFQLWSNAQMEEYGNLFHPKAVIYFRDKYTKEIYAQSLESFLKSQTYAQANPQDRMQEFPLNIQIELTGENTALVSVYWKLQSNSKTVFGYDHFIWAKSSKEWKIVTLFFYNSN